MRRIVTALRRKIAALWPRRPVLVPVPVRRPAAQRGLTLVEMLITVAITLIMMAAVVNVFASIGQGVQHRRATIEVSNQLRIARTLLAEDLSQATATTLPPRDPSSGEGYIELIEGIHTDWYPTRLTDGQSPDPTIGNFEITDLSVVPAGALASDSEIVVQGLSDHYGKLGLSGLGDFDDILALTVRSQGEPFVGRFGTTTIKSHEAEIIWYAVENPAVPRDNPLYLGEPGMRTVYRRVLLIAPWVDADPSSPASLTAAAVSLGVQFNRNDPETWRKFYRNFDVSVRVDPETNRWVPNTLADLTKRENRFAHMTEFPQTQFPHRMDVRRIRHVDPHVYSDSANPGLKSATPLVPFGTPLEYDKALTEAIVQSTGTFNTSDTRLGEDVVLTNVLAFDLRVFDPLAPLMNVNGTVVEPSDLGWRAKGSPNQPWTASGSPVVGRGAYVDLAYNGDPSFAFDKPVFEPSPVDHPDRLDNVSVPIGGGLNTSQFSMIPPVISGFAGSTVLLDRGFYDTWSFHYEYDGIDQDGDDLTDEGTNGVDDELKINGIDDLGERETLPPYLTPLRGIEVKVRIYEPDSRVVREVSVKQNFTPQ